MDKVPQKLEKTRAEMYANAPIAKFGQRKPDFSTMGRKIKNQYRKFQRSCRRRGMPDAVRQIRRSAEGLYRSRTGSSGN